MVTLYQDCSSRYVLSKNMAARGRGLFSLYYTENFNDLLFRNHWTDINITLQECFLCNPLSRLCKPSWFVKKHGRQGAGLIFLIQVSPVITRWLGCTNPDRDIGEARSKFGGDWSDFINVDICTWDIRIYVWRDLWMKTMIFHVIYINKRMSTNVVCFVLFTPLMYFFCNMYAKYLTFPFCGSIRHICWWCNTDGVEVRSHKKSSINTGPREHSELF